MYYTKLWGTPSLVTTMFVVINVAEGDRSYMHILHRWCALWKGNLQPFLRDSTQIEIEKKNRFYNGDGCFILLTGKRKISGSHSSIVTSLYHLLTWICNRFSKAFKIKWVALKNVYSYHEVMDQGRLFFKEKAEHLSSSNNQECYHWRGNCSQ